MILSLFISAYVGNVRILILSRKSSFSWLYLLCFGVPFDCCKVIHQIVFFSYFLPERKLFITMRTPVSIEHYNDRFIRIRYGGIKIIIAQLPHDTINLELMLLMALFYSRRNSPYNTISN